MARPNGGSDGKTVSAAHGFPGTRQNASVRTAKSAEMPKKIEKPLSVFSTPHASAASLRLQLLHGCQRLS
jgi:hypothetical protein